MAVSDKLKALITARKWDGSTTQTLYGVEGIGKTTYLYSMPNAISVCAEDGIPPALSDKPRIVCATWAEVLNAATLLANEAHDFETVGVDTADWAEALVHRHVCQRDGKQGIEDYGYGKGYTIAAEEFRKLLALLDAIHKKGKHVALLAHAQIRPFSNPTGDNFDRYEMKCNKAIAGLLREWPQMVLFARYETFTKKDGLRAKAFGGGRVIHTQWSPAFDAKNRFDLPETLPLSWDEVSGAIHAGASAKQELAEALAGAWTMVEWKNGAEAKALAKLGIKKPDADSFATVELSTLRRCADWVNQLIPVKEQDNASA